MKITSFKNEHRWLSNLYVSPITYLGHEVETVEHAYQLAKTLDKKEQAFVASAATPGLAKKAGRQITLRADWEEVKFDVMLDCLRLKFAKREFKDKLLATGNSELIEGNTWGDKIWGVDNKTGKGENNLGRLLMIVRSES